MVEQASPSPRPWTLTEDDIKQARDAGFDVSSFVRESAFTREGYRAPTDEDRAVSWGDVGRSAAIGAAGIGESLGALTEYATSGAVGGDTRKFFGDVAQDQLERMGPRARRALTSEFFADEGKQSILDDFTASLGLKTVSALPSTVASIIPAGLAVRALSAASVGTRVAVAGATARGTNSVLTGGEVAQQIYSAIDNMSDTDLRNASDLYAGYRSMMSEQEARSQYMRDVAGAAPVVGLAIGALTPGVETTLARRLGGEAAKGVLKGAGRGAVTEAAQEFVEGVSGETLSQSALVEARLKSGMDWEKVLAQGLEGALIGAPMGAGGGALGGIGKRDNVPVIPPTGADPAQSAALGATLPQQGEAPAATDPGAVSQTPKGTGTGVQPKPPENVAVGNPQSAPERSDTRYPKESELTGEVTVPETLDDLRDQQAKLVSGNIPAMLFPWTRKPEKGVRGLTQEFDLPDGFARVMTREGVVHFDPKTFTRQDVIKAANNGRINEILGYVQSKEDVLAAEATGDGPPRAIVERGPNGEERGAALVSPSQEGAQIEAFRQRQLPDSTIVREDPDQTVARRMEPRPVSPEQEYYDAFDEFRAEREAGAQPFEASPENVAYDVELPEQSILTPEQNEELWFINEDRPVGQKMTPEQFLARGQTPPPAAPEGRRGADVVEKSKRRAAEKAARRDEATKKQTKKQADKQAKQPTKATTVPQDGDLGPLFTAPVNTEATADEKPRGLTRLEARMIEKRAREEAEKAEQPSKGKNRTKAEKAALETQDKFGREVAKREPSKDEFYFGPEQDDLLRRSRAEPSAFVQSKVQLRALERRLQSVIDDAKAAGINTEDRTKGNPTGLQKKVFPNTPDGVMYLRVVKDMLGLLKQRRTSDKITQALNQFIVEEHAARQGDFSLMRERRQVEGNERNSRARADVEAPTGAVPTGMTVASPEEQLEQAENAAKRELAMQELNRQREALERGEIKEIDEEKIRQIGGVEKKGEAKPAVFEKPKKATAPKKDTAEGKVEPPKGKSLKGGSLELSEEELARIVTRADARASKPNLADAEMARDRTAKKADPAAEWLKANDPAYKPGAGDPLFMAGTPTTFKTGQPTVVDAYHGTPYAFEQFDPKRRGALSRAVSARRGYFFSSGPQTANTYARRAGSPAMLEIGIDELARAEFGMTQPRRADDGYTDLDVRQANERIAATREVMTPDETAQFNEMMRDYARNPNAKAAAAIEEFLTEADPEASRPNVRLSRLRMQNPLVHDMQGKAYSDRAHSALIDRATAGGHDGIIIQNTTDGGPLDTIYVVFDGSQISDRFNPRRAEGTLFPSPARGRPRKLDDSASLTPKARELLLKSKRISRAQRAALEADLSNEALRNSWYQRWDMASLIENEMDSGDRFISVGGQEYVRTVVSDGNGGRVYSAPGQVLETRSLGEVMQNLVRDDVADGPLFQFTQLILERNAADVPVHFISNEDMQAILPNAEGFYDPVANHIVLPESHRLWAGMASQDIADFFGVEASNVEQYVFNHTVLHEGVHAALRNQLLFDPIAVGQLHAISRELLAAMRRTDPNYGKKYLFANAQEFLAEALSNGARQRDMRSVTITRGLAKALGLPVDRNISLWRAFVFKAADWLGLGANLKSNIDALDAVLSVVQRIDNGGLAPAGFPVLPPGWSKYFAPGGVLPSDRQALSSDYVNLLASGSDPLGPDFLLTRESITDRGKAFGSRMSRVAVKGTTLDQFRQLYRGVFQDSKGDALERVVEGIQRMAPYAAEKRKRAEELAQRFIDFSRTSPLKAAELSEVAIDATMSNVRLGPGADNKHLDKGWRGWQGKTRLNALQARYNALGEDGRSLYNDMASFYRDMQNEMTAGLIDNILNETGVNPPDRQAFIVRVMNGNMSEADKALLADKPTVLKGLQDATELRVVKGDYFPLMRQGDYVVVTNDKIPDLMGGKEAEPGKVEFRGASRKEAMDAARAFAEAMANNADRPLRVINLRQTPDDATSTDFGVVVTVQTKGVFYFDTEAEAIRWRRENADAFDVVEPVQDRLQTAGVSADLTTAQFNSLMASIDRQEGTSDETKALMKGIMEQAAARMMAGNRVQQRSISRRNVLGASKDFGRNLVQYGQASGGYLAKIKYMPTVREALKSMSDLRDNGPAEMKPQRTRLLNEIRARIDQGIIEPTDPPRWLSDLMTLTYLGKLFSPMYSVINGMQPWMVTYPVLAGRYGAVRASRMLGDAYTALGFTDAVTGGIRNTFQAGKQFTAAGLLDTTDVVGSIKKKLAQQPDGADLTALIDMALERGAMSAGGFEMAQALADGRGAWGTNLSRVDRIARQLPQAIEDVNRAVTLVAAYRLARSAQLTHEKAMARAFDTVMNTQGDYSATNAPRFFANPYLRPALQFKKYAQMMTFLMSDMVYRAFKGASPEERRVAQKQIASVLAVQIAMAGALSLPGLEIAKLGFMLAAALGFGDGWDDQEEKLRKLADDTFGKALGQMITSGFITRLPTVFGGSGIDLSQRLSLADMWTFGEPRKYDKDNLNAYLAQMLFGAPGSTAADFFDGIRNVGKGDVLKGIGQMLPIKFVADSFKAANNYSEGKATNTEVAMNIFGVRSGRQAEKGREVAAAIRERAELQDRYKRLSDRYLKARNAGERAVVRAQIVEHNKTAPLRYKVFPGALDKVRERIDAERVN